MTSRLAIFGRRKENPALDFVPNTSSDVTTCLPPAASITNDADPIREEMVESVTELMNGFICQMLGAIIHTLRFLQVPRASTETDQTNAGPPPVGYVEGLCHVIAVASKQLKLCPERHNGRVAEGLRKEFLKLTNAMCSLFELAEGSGRNVSKKIEPTLKLMELESESALMNLYDHKLPKISYHFPNPSPNYIQSTWEESKDDAGNGEPLKILWDPFTQVLQCTLNGSEFPFSQITVENQLKVFHGFLVQALQSVTQATVLLDRSKDSWKQAKRDLSHFWTYLLQLESKEKIRPEEKDALLLLLRAHLRTTHHLLDQLKRTLKRSRVSLSHAIWNIRSKLKELENVTQVTSATNPKGNPFGYSGISVQISQSLQLSLSERNEKAEEAISDEAKEFKVTAEFFSGLRETTKQVTGESLSSLLATHELLCGVGFGRHDHKQSKVIGLLATLGQTLVSIGNFRDCSEIQRSLLTNGLKQLLAKLDELMLGSSIHVKLRQELEATGRETDLIAMEIRALMNVVLIPPPGNEAQFRILENQSTATGTAMENLWTLKLCQQFPESGGGESTGMQLLLSFQNTEIKYNELSRVKQGRVVVEVLRFLLSLVDEISSSLQSAILDFRKGSENLKSLKSELTLFIKNEGYGPDIEMSSELSALINLLHQAKETAEAIFRQINSEMRKASRFLRNIESYAKARLRIEAPFPSVLARHGSHRMSSRSPVPELATFRHEQAQEIRRKNRKKVSEIETALKAALQEVKVIQIPLKLKTEGRHFPDPCSVGPLEVN